MVATPPDAVRPTVEDVNRAADRLRPIVVRTPLVLAHHLSELLHRSVFFKPENLQRTGSFKIRGAANRILALPPDQRRRGVIAASAGNHGQGVALAARLLGVRAVIVMPAVAPVTKVNAVASHGAEVVLDGDAYEAALDRARIIEREQGLTFVHPFDDWDVIAGQATIGREIVEDLPDVGTVVVPVGGGGLIAGVAAAVKQASPSAQVIGVQAAGAAAAVASFAAGERRAIDRATTVADGIRVRAPGERALLVMRRHVDAMVAVDDEAIYRAVVHLLERARLVVEPAGAVGVAALSERLVTPPDRPIVVVLSGGNVDPTLLTDLVKYGLAHAGRYLIVRARLPDRPGELVDLLRPIAESGVNIVSIEHHRSEWGLPVTVSEVVLQLETRGIDHSREIVTALRSSGRDVQVVWPGDF